MKRYLSGFLICCCIYLLSCLMIANADGVYKKSKMIRAQAQTKRIPSGTKLLMKLQTPISSESSAMGDVFELSLMKDQKVDGVMVLPKGTLVRGTVGKVKATRRLSRGAILYLNFDHVVTTTGKQIPISAGLCNVSNITLDGGLRSSGNYGYALKMNTKKSGEIIKASTKWGIDIGSDWANGYPKYIITPIAAIGGTIGGGAYLIGDSVIDLFRKGQPLILHQEDLLEVQLVRPLDIPLY